MATMPTVQDWGGLPDPFLGYRWTFIIPNFPIATNSRRLQLQCKTNALPGMSTEEVMVTSHGIDIPYMGRQMFGGNTMTATFYETRELIVHNTFRRWLELGRNHRAATGNFKSKYATKAQLIPVDDQNNIIQTYNFENLFVQELPEGSLDGSSSAPVEFSVVFKFDSWYVS